MRVTCGNKTAQTGCWNTSRHARAVELSCSTKTWDWQVPRHGDDYGMLGGVEATMYLEEILSEKHVYKRLAASGFESSDGRHAVFLNEVLSVKIDANPKEIVYEPAARHARSLIRELDEKKSISGQTLAEHRSVERQIADFRTTRLEVGTKKKFRPHVMRATYMAQEDPSTADAVKSVAGRVSSRARLIYRSWNGLKNAS